MRLATLSVAALYRTAFVRWVTSNHWLLRSLVRNYRPEISVPIHFLRAKTRFFDRLATGGVMFRNILFLLLVPIVMGWAGGASGSTV